MIDVASGTHADNTVLISGNRVTYAGPASGARIPSAARVVDGRGKFLIPGLWDMHVHAFLYVFSDFAGPLMIANGVTGARDMGYYIDTTMSWRSRIASDVKSVRAWCSAPERTVRRITPGLSRTSSPRKTGCGPSIR